MRIVQMIRIFFHTLYGNCSVSVVCWYCFMSVSGKCCGLRWVHGRGFWYCAGIEAYKRHLIFVWVWREDGNRFFRMRFSFSSCAFLFWSSLICFAVRISPLDVSTVEYCLIHLERAVWKTLCSLIREACVLPLW